MHNRARMITASFLTKDLYLDWRDGAAHFMRLLTDGDIACNQLNWQWVAGTGTDTSAHRIFNPTLQGPQVRPGRQLCAPVPARAGGPARGRDPRPGPRHPGAARGYPEPIVDHRAAVARVPGPTARTGLTGADAVSGAEGPDAVSGAEGPDAVSGARLGPGRG